MSEHRHDCECGDCELQRAEIEIASLRSRAEAAERHAEALAGALRWWVQEHGERGNGAPDDDELRPVDQQGDEHVRESMRALASYQGEERHG